LNIFKHFEKVLAFNYLSNLWYLNYPTISSKYYNNKEKENKIQSKEKLINK
jgi:hypothetical protein